MEPLGPPTRLFPPPPHKAQGTRPRVLIEALRQPPPPTESGVGLPEAKHRAHNAHDVFLTVTSNKMVGFCSFQNSVL